MNTSSAKEDETVELDTWKNIAKPPIGTTLLSNLSLLSPYTWWRIAVIRNHTNFIPTIVKGITALCVPPLGTGIYYYYFSTDRYQSRQQHGREKWNTGVITVTYLLSPYSLAIIYRIGCVINQVKDDLLYQFKQKSHAKPQAWKCLADLILSDRAYRTRQYDVYLPYSKLDSHSLDGDTINPVIFIPGAGVDHTSYSEICSLFAEHGYLVVVMSLEPLRLADGYLSGSNISLLRSIMKTIAKVHYSQLIGGLKTEQWAIIGHSMGSLTGTKIASVLGIRRLVMLGSAPFIGFVHDISSSDIKVQVIQGSNDIVIDTFSTPELIEQFWQRLPPASKDNCHIIQGGTHSGFSNYTSCWKPEVDGIPVHEQHIETVTVAHTFLRQSF